MKKKAVFILIIILILIFIFLSFYKSKKNIFDDITIFSLWNGIGDKNEYVINPEKRENIKIDVFKTVEKGTEIYKKIAPGSHGKFTIKLTKPIEANSDVVLKELSNKPQNLIFTLNQKQYDSIEKMQQEINEIFKIQDEVTIYWEWPYELDTENDIQDTKEGEKAERYLFEVNAIIE